MEDVVCSNVAPRVVGAQVGQLYFVHALGVAVVVAAAAAAAAAVPVAMHSCSQVEIEVDIAAAGAQWLYYDRHYPLMEDVVCSIVALRVVGAQVGQLYFVHALGVAANYCTNPS
jgi:hypothetical protein